ncbi:peroxiredoxin (alkyl hydroperoxide reductase subunit C) [Cytobacillus oceanisediminis]|uniref:Peroxiredoxin (Alkyl hydroperoxide reductase subunit C) n=1 Tax=Cytobacillus oceanisediminis TaxID=665099 RepID=A0A2V2ZMP0_9BACI|nr:peroxiredoxin (alkyl hydroperoxide reductase subunit C) [Cytobacillus oceanisediminis]
MAAVAAINPYLKALNCEVMSISTDSVYSHKVFKETSPSLKNVNFPMVSDRTHTISRAYRVLDEKSGAAVRASVFIDPNGIISAKLIYPGEVGRNLHEHVRIMQGIQYAQQTGQGVPANWKPGEPGITRDPNLIGKI